MKSIIFVFALMVVASCDVAFLGQGWSKDDSGYNYPKAKAYEIYEENDLVEEIDFTPDGIDIFEIQPKADEVVIEGESTTYLSPVPQISTDYLPATEDRKRRLSQIKRQVPAKRILRRANKKL